MQFLCRLDSRMCVEDIPCVLSFGTGVTGGALCGAGSAGLSPGNVESKIQFINLINYGR